MRFEYGTVHPAPDWVMIGVRVSEGVLIYASRTLSSVQLEVIVEEIETFGHWMPRHVDTEIELTTTMRSYVVAHGRTYADAIRNLMEYDVWNNYEEAGRPGVLVLKPDEITEGS